MKKRVPLTIAAMLTACGAVATTSNDSAESAPQKSTSAKTQQSSADMPRATNASADQSGVDPWAGKWRGSGEMTITAAGPNRYSVSIETGAPGCGGEIQGAASATANRLTLSVKPPQAGYQQCTITMDRDGASARLTESGDCYLFYGGQCEFGGDYNRLRSATAGASNPAGAASSQPFIVGAWVSRGFACGGEGLIYEADGTYNTDAQSGRWQLSGNVLTETALQTFEMGEDETPIRNPRPVRSQILSVAPNRNAYSIRTADGEVWHMVRCR